MKSKYAQVRRPDWILKHLLHYFIRLLLLSALGGVKVCFADSYLRTVFFCSGICIEIQGTVVEFPVETLRWQEPELRAGCDLE